MVPLIAGGVSFLMAKASGASNKQALLSGIVGAAGAFGAAKLGGVLATSGTLGAPTATQLFGQKLAESGIAQFAA